MTEAPTVLDETTLDTGEAAAFLHTTPRTVVRWMTAGYRPAEGGLIRLEAVRVGRTWRTSREAVLRFLAAGSPSATPQPIEPQAKRDRSSKAADESLARWGIVVAKKSKAGNGAGGEGSSE